MKWAACVEKFHSRQHATPAAARAINRAIVAPPPSGDELASEWEKRWANGQKLRISFLDGSAKLQQKVEEVARGWLAHANLEFQFGRLVDADIRISFQQEGYWSYVGTDARFIDVAEPTMNFGGWNASTVDDEPDEIRRVVLHEFGHAIGCIHEHSSPAAGIPWDVERVIAYYRLTQGWQAQDTYDQVLFKYSVAQVRATDWDRDSIMQYPVEAGLVTDPSFAVGWNSALSPTDIAFVKTMYPGR